jgi:hypothetical protein
MATLYVLSVLILTALSLAGFIQQVATRKQRRQAREASQRIIQQRLTRSK